MNIKLLSVSERYVFILILNDIIIIIIIIDTNNIIILYSGTSVYSRDSSIQGTQNLAPTNIHIIFLSVSSVEGTPLFRGKGHFFLVLNPRFYLHSGDTLVLRMWLTTKRV